MCSMFQCLFLCVFILVVCTSTTNSNVWTSLVHLYLVHKARVYTYIIFYKYIYIYNYIHLITLNHTYTTANHKRQFTRLTEYSPRFGDSHSSPATLWPENTIHVSRNSSTQRIWTPCRSTCSFTELQVAQLPTSVNMARPSVQWSRDCPSPFWPESSSEQMGTLKLWLWHRLARSSLLVMRSAGELRPHTPVGQRPMSFCWTFPR